MEEHQAEEIVLLDLRTISILADYFVVCSASSDRQSRDLIEIVDDEIGHHGRNPRGREGTPEAGWSLIDYGDVVLHVFSRDKRKYYTLDQFWNEALVVVKVQ